MKPPYGEAAGGGAGRVAVSKEFGILKYQIRSRYTTNEDSLSKEFCERGANQQNAIFSEAQFFDLFLRLS
jgi:hypothetical protein